MSGFGDHEPDDSFDTAPVDAEQVARKFHDLRQRNDPNHPWPRRFDDLDPDEQRLLLLVFALLIAWLRRQGAIR